MTTINHNQICRRSSRLPWWVLQVEAIMLLVFSSNNRFQAGNRIRRNRVNHRIALSGVLKITLRWHLNSIAIWNGRVKSPTTRYSSCLLYLLTLITLIQITKALLWYVKHLWKPMKNSILQRLHRLLGNQLIRNSSSLTFPKIIIMSKAIKVR